MLAACLKEQLSLQAGAHSCWDLPGDYADQASEVAYLRLVKQMEPVPLVPCLSEVKGWCWGY